MTYTLALCLGMFLSLCGQYREFDYPSLAECEQARRAIPPSAIGSGYAICAPRKPDKRS